MIHNNINESGSLSLGQRGLLAGLNGMAVGGRRRITIQLRLVCEEYGTEVANPKISCGLVSSDRKGEGGQGSLQGNACHRSDSHRFLYFRFPWQ